MNTGVDLRMYKYINTKTNTSVIILNTADELMIDGVKYIREDKMPKSDKTIVKEEKK